MKVSQADLDKRIENINRLLRERGTRPTQVMLEHANGGWALDAAPNGNRRLIDRCTKAEMFDHLFTFESGIIEGRKP